MRWRRRGNEREVGVNCLFPIADPLEISPETILRSQWIRMTSRLNGIRRPAQGGVSNGTKNRLFATRTKRRIQRSLHSCTLEKGSGISDW